MTDERMTRLCLEAMYERSPTMPEGCWSVDPECRTAEWWKVDGHWRCGRCQLYFDPLKEDAHAMALVKKLEIAIWLGEDHVWFTSIEGEMLNADGGPPKEWEVRGSGKDLNRAIAQCVANLHATSTRSAK